MGARSASACRRPEEDRLMTNAPPMTNDESDVRHSSLVGHSSFVIGSHLSRAADPDVQRMLGVQRGEPGAFAELVERYWDPIVGRFYRQLGDRQEAEDLAQDVFLRLFRARLSYR